jgi:D-alanyl-D-alanine carboxypeptidase
MKVNILTVVLLAGLGPYLDELVKRDAFSGTVLVARNGEPVFFQSYGLANREAGIPNNNDTKYNLGSINKVFTQIALTQLQEQGKIDFDQTLRTYLPDYPSDVADKITIRQIYEHRSGLGDIFGPAYDAADRSKLRSLKNYVPLFADKPLEFEPGTGKRYSNAGYIVLGLVIERLSGMSYYDYVRKNIFEPAGMKDTESWAVDDKVQNRATGYTKRGSNLSTLPARGSSAGGGYSTASDLLRFVQALHAGKLTRKPPQGRAGWGGGAPGINAMLEDAGEWVIVVLSNYDPPAAQDVARHARTLLGIADEDESGSAVRRRLRQ